MNYQIIYDNIIYKANNRIIDEYTETHHIIPKCMGGKNTDINLVKLTPKEHFICHKLLCEIYPTNPKLKFAYWAMCNKLTKNKESRTYIISASEYSRAKLQHSKLISEYMFMYNPSHRADVKEKLSKIHTGKKHTAEHNKKKGRACELNVSKRDDVRLKISEKLKGHTISEETKRKISETLKAKTLQKI
jgi:hypothetical protein